MRSEPIKGNSNNGFYINQFFWRIHRQSENDYIEEEDGQISANEFRWKSGKKKIPKIFIDLVQSDTRKKSNF